MHRRSLPSGGRQRRSLPLLKELRFTLPHFFGDRPGVAALSVQVLDDVLSAKSYDQTRTLCRCWISRSLPFLVRAADAEPGTTPIQRQHAESSFSHARRSGAFLLLDCIQLANAAGFSSVFQSGGATERRLSDDVRPEKFTRQLRGAAGPRSYLCRRRSGLSLRKVQRQIRSRGFSDLHYRDRGE